MKNKSLKKVCIVLSAVFIGIFCGCTVSKEEKTTVKAYGISSYSEFFNTSTTIVVYFDRANQEELSFAQQAICSFEEGESGKIKEKGKALQTISFVEEKLSVAKENSDIKRFNDAQPGEIITIDKLTYTILQKAKRLYEQTQGAYNPAVSLLVDLWGFSPIPGEKAYSRKNPESELPQEKYIQAFKQLTDFEQVELNNNNEIYTIKKPNVTQEVDGISYTMQLDLGGIGKGYACDLVYDILREHFSYGYVNIGGSSLKFLKSYKQYDSVTEGDWKISVKNPREENYIDTIDDYYLFLNGKEDGMSTSGDYELYYEYLGKRYCHIISAETGSPIQTNVVTASILGGEASDNDALTTAICVMGKDKAIEFMNTSLIDKKVCFVWYNEESKIYEIISNLPKEEIKTNSSLKQFKICGYKENDQFVYFPSSIADENNGWESWQFVVLILGVTISVFLIGGGIRYVVKHSRKSKDK